MKKIFCISVLLFLTTNQPLNSQSTQMWWDYFGYPMRDINWDYEINAGYNHLLSEGGWYDFYCNNTITFQKLRWIMFDGGVEFHLTHDPSHYNSVEIRPWVMTTARWMTEGEYINLYRPYIAVMIEQRNILYQDEELNQHKFRLRLGVGGKITLNSKTMSVGTIYFTFRGTYFIDINGSAVERFAKNHRIEFGLGYIISSAIRMELNYYLQGSRNTYEEDFIATDNIFQFALRHYF